MGDLLRVDHRREGVELLEDMVRAPVASHLRHRPVRIRRVAERNRPRRTRLRARRRELVGCSSRFSSLARFSASRMRCTQKRALLHHALAADGDVRVELPVQRLGERVLAALRLAVAEPVEVADLVRAVVRAVARADAAVVDLHVQPVGRVVRREDRAHRLARRVAAVLAEHRHKARVEVGVEAVLPPPRAFVVALETIHVISRPLMMFAPGVSSHTPGASARPCHGAPTVGRLFSA